MAKTLFGIMLLAFGGMLLFHVLGLGWIFKLLIFLAIVVYGLKKIHHAETMTQKGLGIVILLFGFLLLIGGANVLIGLLVGFTLIFVGVKLIKQNDNSHQLKEKLTLQGNVSVHEDAFDREWNEKMKTKMQGDDREWFLKE